MTAASSPPPAPPPGPPPEPVFLATAVEIVLRAGAIQEEGRASGFRVAKKGAIDLVTEIDLACERMCRELLAERFPITTSWRRS